MSDSHKDFGWGIRKGTDSGNHTGFGLDTDIDLDNRTGTGLADSRGTAPADNHSDIRLDTRKGFAAVRKSAAWFAECGGANARCAPRDRNWANSDRPGSRFQLLATIHLFLSDGPERN